MKNTHKIIGLVLTIVLLSCGSSVSKHGLSKTDLSYYESVFKDLKEFLSNENGKLWNHQLYGPLILINRNNRLIIANEADNNGSLTKNGKVFTGILPNEFNIANTSFEWNGKRWTMVALPLPKDYNESLNLLTHELFHRIQPEIGFADLYQKPCNHLDKLNGRIYLKLELEALKKALSVNNETIQNKHIQNALLFRLYRQQLFPEAKETENLLELKEGLAEYTGTILSGRTDENLRNHYIKAIETLYENTTFVRSFAYRTTPVYGYFMNQNDKNWNLRISSKTNLTDFTLEFFNISVPINLTEKIERIQNDYNYVKISDFENVREQKQKELIAKLDEMFQKNNTLSIPLQNMRIGFNPGNLIPYRDFGTVYPNLRITDNWGILVAEKEALVNKNWNKVIVSEPTEITKEIIKGDGWELELNKDWKLVKTEDNYTLKKK